MIRFFSLITIVAILCSCDKGDSPINGGVNNSGNNNEQPTVESTLCERQGSGKAIYIPQEFKKNNDFRNTTNQYCYKRSLETENLIILWDKKFGDDPSNAPKLGNIDMSFDIKKLAEQGEQFYDIFKNELKFIKSGSNADKYKMMIMVTYTNEGTVYGGSYDNVIGALWVEPSRIKDVRLNALAHELGHSFQFQLSIDSGSGFGSGGIYEMTSQWMLWQTNPYWFDDETYHWDAYMNQTHLAFNHPDNMYHTANLLEYWSYLHGKDFIAELWRSANRTNDPVVVYQYINKCNQEEFNDENYAHASKQIFYDIPRIKEACAKYAGRHKSELGEADADGWRTIKNAPQQYGYNGIQLESLSNGESLTLEFKSACSHSDAGWRFGIVGKTKDGSIVYGDMVSSDGSSTVSHTFQAENDYDSLWLVVTAAPSSHTSLSDQSASQYKTYPYSVRISIE